MCVSKLILRISDFGDLTFNFLIVANRRPFTYILYLTNFNMKKKTTKR